MNEMPKKSKIGLALFHDAVFEATGKSLNDSELETVFRLLPEFTQTLGIEWGLSDTEFREQVMAFLSDLMKKRKAGSLVWTGTRKATQ